MRSITMGMCLLKEKGKEEVFLDVIANTYIERNIR